ncbi:MAG TPA: hypothetical protein VK929_02385 [Longimicrobiales bacterium]|nr:hypothetical protein [Longimicrobiales bacterium]
MRAVAGWRQGRRVFAWLLPSVVAAGCAAPASTAGTALADADCVGTSVIVVHNNTGHTVSVVEARRSVNATGQFAQVGPGTHEFTVRGEADYYYRVLPPRDVPIEEQRRIMRGSAVRLTRECRPADGRAP